MLSKKLIIQDKAFLEANSMEAIKKFHKMHSSELAKEEKDQETEVDRIKFSKIFNKLYHIK